MIWLILSGAVCLALLLAVAFWPRLHIERYTLHSNQVRSPLTIVALSDLHSTPTPFDDLAAAIRAENPDVLFLVGDIVDDRAPVEGAVDFLSDIEGICPAYYVTGNHEYRSGRAAEFCELIESCGVRVLSDEVDSLRVGSDTIYIAGLEDPDRSKAVRSYNQHAVMGEAFSGVGELPGYRILLAHRPERIEQYKAYPFDLVLSGHAHGGQIRIPFLLNGIFAPNQGLFPKYAGGLYTHGTLSHIVCRGVSNFGLPLPRVFNPPELAVITLTGQ